MPRHCEVVKASKSISTSLSRIDTCRHLQTDFDGKRNSWISYTAAGVILESEDLHRVAYNAAFEHFDVRPKGEDTANWSSDFYDKLQNKIGGGKPKMRWYFGNIIVKPRPALAH